jgi:hypothetical protein
MASEASPPAVASKSTGILLIVRVWAAFIALCHLGGLAGIIVPLVIRPASGRDFAITLLSLSHHIVALVTAVVLLVGLRGGRFGLMLALALGAAYGVFMLSASVWVGAASFAFALLLYVPPLVLIYWRPAEFR